jgi:hypothetical protein
MLQDRVGRAKGSAGVRLAPNGRGTRLTYDMDADVTGKFAQLGSRLIQGAANVLAGQFFTRFNEVVSNPDTVRPSQTAKISIPWWIWGTARRRDSHRSLFPGSSLLPPAACCHRPAASPV